MTNRLPGHGNERDRGEGEEKVPRPDRPEEKSPGPPEGSAGTPELSGVQGDVDAEEEAIRAEMAELGFVPVDPATLKKGPPLSQEDWQTLFRFRRDPTSMSPAEQLRIIKLIRQNDSWYHADREVVIQCATEFGQGFRNRN